MDIRPGAEKSSDDAADQLGGVVDHRDDAGVIQAGRADDTDNADDFALAILEGCDNQRRSRQREELVLGADENRDAVAFVGLAEELNEFTFRFDVVEQLADAFEFFDGCDILEEVGLAADDQALAVVEAAGPGGEAGLDDVLSEGIEFGLGAGGFASRCGRGLRRGSSREYGR